MWTSTLLVLVPAPRLLVALHACRVTSRLAAASKRGRGSATLLIVMEPLSATQLNFLFIGATEPPPQ
ncbi:hypothetical protein EYF80_059778 [Liparis tanakae]|uniref:Secreted protein n=1 Tax=Liparis tanakae TaxID=230148 RepID=A0A4Z2EMJ4_9TELE|nr:hypothetical protein EYF80_059778 [Liparis tanakae]